MYLLGILLMKAIFGQSIRCLVKLILRFVAGKYVIVMHRVIALLYIGLYAIQAKWDSEVRSEGKASIMEV